MLGASIVARVMMPAPDVAAVTMTMVKEEGGEVRLENEQAFGSSSTTASHLKCRC